MESEKEKVIIDLLKSLYVLLDNAEQTIENGMILYITNFEKANLEESLRKNSNITFQQNNIFTQNKTEEQVDKQKNLIEIIDKIKSCNRCELSLKRISTVPGVGPLDSKVMIIGEAPGEQEDIQGLPFVGKAGQLLSKILANSGLEREKIYITNCVKCRPPNNRVPSLQEMLSCSVYLKKQIDLIKPRFIIALGATAIQFLLQKKVAISKVRGMLIEANVYGEKVFIYPTYHPSFLLRDNTNISVAQKDFDKIALLLKKNKLI